VITRIVENAENFGPDFDKVSANKKIQIQNKNKKNEKKKFTTFSKFLPKFSF
jgi:hypothetical protein